MRIRPLIPCLLAPALVAQAPADPAEARMAQVKADADPAAPRFVLLHPLQSRFQGPWELDSAYLRTAADGEIRVFNFVPGEQEAWASRQGWGAGDYWLLLSPEGEPLLSGASLPDASALLGAMREHGWTPRQERLAQFLQTHPDNGNAWAEALYDEAGALDQQQFIGRRIEGKPLFTAADFQKPSSLDAEQDSAKWGPVARAMNGLLGTDGWTFERKLPETLVRLGIIRIQDSTVMKDPLWRMEQGIKAEIRLHPSSSHLWEMWGTLQYLGLGDGTQALMDGLDPMPRMAWPPLAAASPIGAGLAKAGRWEELEAIASHAYTQALDPGLLPYEGADARQQVVVSWGFWRLVALAKSDRRLEVEDFLKELRAESGSAWPRVASGPLAESLRFYLAKDDALLAELAAAKTAKAPPDPPKPGFPSPLRLALVGHPNWEKEWNRYPSLSVFDPWEPDEELGWKPLTPAEEKALRARMSWGAEPHWALMRGPDCLASGAALPKASFLADRLRTEGTPYLAQLDAFIRTHPDRLDAREARLAELRGRMPNERLEADLLEDARITLKPFGPGKGSMAKETEDWTPRKELWEPAARKVLPELEARIRRWPERPEAWEAWFDWTSLMDHPPSPAQFMDGLDIWKTRFDGGPGPLPEPVMIAGTMALTSAARWQDLADWCQRFWEGGVRGQLERHEMALNDPRPRSHREDHMELVEAMLLSPYVEALEKLHHRAELQAFLQDVQSMDPAIAKRLTASSTPPRLGK